GYDVGLGIQLQAQFVGRLVVPAVVTVELGFHRCVFSLNGFQALVDGGHGGLDALQAFFHQVEVVIHGVEAFVQGSEPAINRLKAPVEILVQLGPLGVIIHMFLHYVPGRRNGQVTIDPAQRENERNH
ncbi:MAG: hypothetical protein LC799_11520, partial [Actinobacteria bacterium]|nr:hypothetical protein [Actinomycetota bacterium]